MKSRKARTFVDENQGDMHVFLKLKAGKHRNWPSLKKKTDTPQEKLLLSATTVFLTKAGVHQKPAEDFFPMTDSTKGGRSSSPPVGMALRFLWEKIKPNCYSKRCGAEKDE